MITKNDAGEQERVRLFCTRNVAQRCIDAIEASFLEADIPVPPAASVAPVLLAFISYLCCNRSNQYTSTLD